MQDTVAAQILGEAVEDLSSLHQELLRLYEEAIGKVSLSVERYCEQGNSRGMEQMIGRQFENLWEQLLRTTFQSDNRSLKVGPPIYFQEFVRDYIKSTIAQGNYEEEIANEIERIITEYAATSGTSKMDLCDFTVSTDTQKFAIDPKWRFISNDAKTIRQIAFSGRQLTKLGYRPILLIRRPRIECLTSPLDRFANNGWSVLHAEASHQFIEGLTGFDLAAWIAQNVDVWSQLKDFYNCLQAYQKTGDSFAF